MAEYCNCLSVFETCVLDADEACRCGLFGPSVSRPHERTCVWIAASHQMDHGNSAHNVRCCYGNPDGHLLPESRQREELKEV
ncbi:hypothetical protein QQF64_003336 [Cirrhinus molitorella]|uniref:Uncharacterized protein n=1 Tax=Cirrhinus molitorella TaxID=172907 RepID=A0ABR3ML09_9TELE